VVDACAWANQTSMKFANSAELAARTDVEGLRSSRPGEIPEDLHPSETYFEARCAPLDQLLIEGLARTLTPEEVKELLERPSRPRIDLLSVDAEGAELEIFKSFPFDVFDIRCIVVETSRRTSMAMDSLLLPQAFVKVAVLGKDAVYLSQEQLKSFPRGGKLQLPSRIQWNAPGSESDSIEYVRFQRMFGADGDLDEDVGDQRLQNQTELLRQAERQEARNQQITAEAKELVSSAVFGGALPDAKRKMLEDPEVKAVLESTKLRHALHILQYDMDSFFGELRADATLSSNIRFLCDIGWLEHEETCKSVA